MSLVEIKAGQKVIRVRDRGRKDFPLTGVEEKQISSLTCSKCSRPAQVKLVQEGTDNYFCIDCFEEWAKQHKEEGERLLVIYGDDSNDESSFIHRVKAKKSLIPPKDAQVAARRALEWRRKYGRGMTPVGIARARDLANGKNLSPKTIRRMRSFFARHGVNRAEHFELEDGKPTTWRIAWDGWGGDPGRRWVESVKLEDEKSRSEELVEFLDDLPDRFVWIPDFVSLTGSQIYAKDREPHDADVILRASDLDGSFYVTEKEIGSQIEADAAFALKLERLLKDCLGADRIQYTNSAYGPNWKSLPLYDLCLVRKPVLEYREQNEPEFAEMEYKAVKLTRAALDRKLRGAPATIKTQAFQTWKEDAVKPGRMVLSLKPLRPAVEGERQTVDHFYDFIEENLEFPLFVSAKRDGATIYFHGDGKRVWAFSDDGADRTDDLPTLTAALKKNFRGKSFVIGCEVEKWVDGEHYPREAAIGDVKKGEDQDLACNIFRLIYWDGKDLHAEPFENVWSVMRKLPVDTRSDGALRPTRDGHINLVPHYQVGSLSELKKHLSSTAYKPGVEGVVVKRADTGFPLDGEADSSNPEEIKWHKSMSGILRVTGRKETKTAGVYVYNIAIEDLEIGKTFGSKLDLPRGSSVEVETEQMNVERDTDGEITGVSFWAPELIGKSDRGAESLATITNRAKKHGILREKVKDGTEIKYLPNLSGRASTAYKARQSDIDEYPDEDRKLRFTAQNHARGKSLHLDLRFQYKRGEKDFLRGWTVSNQIAEEIKEPVITLEELRRIGKDPSKWKMNLQTGEIKPRETRAGVVRRRGNLRAFPKAPEVPSDWLDEEGVTQKQDPGEPPPAGATRRFPGVFDILDTGSVTWGSQKPWVHEFFIDGARWKGRWLFRLVQRRGTKYFSPENQEEYEAMKQVLPPGEEEADARRGAYWILMQPLDQTPYVLGKEAVDEGWLPPPGVSALPPKMRKSVPERLRYWRIKNEKEAIAARDELAEYEEIGGTELKQRSVKFVLTRRDFRGPIVIRGGSSTVVHDLFIGDGRVWRLELIGDPTKGKSIAGTVEKSVDIGGKNPLSLERGSEIDLRPGTALNPTKETPAKLTVLDSGTATELSEEPTHRKYHFKGEELKGTFFFQPEEEPGGLWLMERSEGPKTKE